jgi:hypothetical protein
VKSALDTKSTARNNAQIDRAIEASSRMVEGLLNRFFYPLITTKYFDWPQPQGNRSWRLWLEDNELISLTSVTSGGVLQTLSNFNLEPQNEGPPYDRLESNRGLSSVFTSGTTPQRAVALAGTFGGCAIDESNVGLCIEVMDASETGMDVDGPTSTAVGVGSLIKLDSERMLVTGRQQLSTGQTLQATVTAAKNITTIAVTTGSSYAIGERILIDAEYMDVVDIAGNNLTVIRGADGSTLAAHNSATTIYAPRTLTVQRGSLGTTAASHLINAPVYNFNFPGPVRALTAAETLLEMGLRPTGYAMVANATAATQRVSLNAIEDIRKTAMQACGRKARMRGV